MYFVYVKNEYDGDDFESFIEAAAALSYIEERLDDGVVLERIRLIDGRERSLKPVTQVTRVEIV